MKEHAQQGRATGFRWIGLTKWIGLAWCAALAGCAGAPEEGNLAMQSREDLRGLEAGERAAQPERRSSSPMQPPAQTGERRVAVAAGVPVYWEDLQPALAEAAGREALQELVLDRMLGAELRRLGLTVTPEDVARERNLVAEAIARDAAADPDNTERLLEGVRRGRGLGPHRFERLLERTAKLRKMVAPEVEVTDEELRQAFAMRHGERYRVRAAVFTGERAAAEAREELAAADPSTRGVRFADIAARRSIDPSAERGGLLEPISPADPAYPAAIRQVLPRLKAGELSPVLAVDRGFALLLVEEVLPGDQASFEGVAQQLEADVRLRRERILMDDLARRLIGEANVSVMDRSLGWSWEGK